MLSSLSMKCESVSYIPYSELLPLCNSCVMSSQIQYNLNTIQCKYNTIQYNTIQYNTIQYNTMI